MGLHQRRRQWTAARAAVVNEYAARNLAPLALVLGLLVTVGVTAAPAMATEDFSGSAVADTAVTGLQKPVTLDVAMADLHLVIATLQKETGAEVVIQDGDKPYPKVSISLKNASMEKALRNIAISANASLRREPDGVWVISPKDPVQPRDAAPSGDAETVRSHISATMTWKKLALRNADPVQLLEMMHWDQYVRDVDRAVPAHMVTGPITSSGTSIVNLGNGNTEQQAIPSVMPGHGTTGAEAANRSVNPESPEQAQQFPGGRGGPPPGFGGQAFQQQGGGNNNGAGGAGGLPPGVDKVYALQQTNELFILATPEGYAAIKDIVKNLDIAPRQVQIKLEYVTARIKDVDAATNSFSLVPYPGIGVQSPGAATAGTDSTAFTIFTGNLAAKLFVTLTKSRSKLVSAPTITTTNNTPAFVNLSTQIPYTTQTVVTANGNNGNLVTNQQNFITVPTNFTVTPRINANDTITMFLNPTLSDITPPASGTGPPAVSSQSISTLRTIRNGETMVLAGFQSKTETRVGARFPILSDIPIIGNLFRQKNYQVQSDELLVFITATIIDSVGDSPDGSVTP